MERTYNYTRIIDKNRNATRLIDLGRAGVFHEINFTNCDPSEEESVGDILFKSIHLIFSAHNQKKFTAFRSEGEPEILLIVWRDFPYYREIEEGGDVMLQVLHDDRRVKHLIIDNTYVKSGWMDDRHLVNYLDNGWIPGLIKLGLKGFCHLQAKSLLGGRSFKSFGRYMNNNFIKIAQKLDREPFQYFPIETSEMNEKRSIDQHVRALAFKKSHAILKSL